MLPILIALMYQVLALLTAWKKKKAKRKKRKIKGKYCKSSATPHNKPGSRGSQKRFIWFVQRIWARKWKKKCRPISLISLSKDKWDFLAPGEGNFRERFVIVFDKTNSPESFYLDSTPQKEAPVYKIGIRGVLNGNWRVTELGFPEETYESRAKSRPFRAVLWRITV